MHQDVLEEIEHRVVQGLDNRDAVFGWIVANFPHELGITADEYDVHDLAPAVKDALVAAIEQAFAKRAKEMEAWPAVTDCERLRAAFERLDAQGIVALDSPGLTQDDGIPQAADVASARDELGGEKTHAYCFYTWNDMARAIDGEGLSLAYGTFESEPEVRAEAPPAPCPLCKGRGWLPPSDPTAFPATCSCRTAPVTPTAAAAASPSLAQRVGAAVLSACRDAGLDAQWTGAANAYVELPKFRWQRRPLVSQEPDVRDFLDGWELEMRAGYLSADEMLTTLDERAADWFETFSDFGPSLQARLRAHTERFLEQEQARESTWSEATTNDRLTAAFGELQRRGIFAREALGTTIQDGWAYAGVQAEPSSYGVVFFHDGDIIDGVRGHGLYLAFGAVGMNPAEDDARSTALAEEVVSALQVHGIACSWSRALRERIRLAPFEWRKRRWTQAPAYPVVQAAPGAPTKARDQEPTCVPVTTGVVVRAARDRGTYDLRRQRLFQASWAAHGNEGEAQAGSAGVPHVFIRPGSHFSLTPQRAAANLRAEKDALFLRGAKSRKI